MESTLLTLAFAAALAWLACLLRAARNGKRDRLPPGPPTIPILGNLLQLSSPRMHLQSAHIRRAYPDYSYLFFADSPNGRRNITQTSSPYVSIPIFLFPKLILDPQVMLGPAPAIILSSARAVKEVLDKQSGSTSDRPPLHINMVVTGDLDIVLARYSAFSTLSSCSCAPTADHALSRAMEAYPKGGTPAAINDHGAEVHPDPGSRVRPAAVRIRDGAEGERSTSG